MFKTKKAKLALPVISSITFDKASYTPGQTITATLKFSGTNTTSKTYNLNGTVKDNVTGEVSTVDSATFSVLVANALTASVADSGSRLWTPGATDNETSAVFTAVA